MRQRRLLRELLSHLLGLRLRNVRPTMVDLCFPELLCHLRLHGSKGLQLLRRGNDVKLVSLHRRLEGGVTLCLGGVIYFVRL